MSGCPGSMVQDFTGRGESASDESGKRQSQLRQWPIQLHLVTPQAPYFNKADVLIAADCVAFSVGDFHKDFLKGKSLAIACPKLDEGQESYVEKITQLIDEANVNTLTVMIMQVPCCMGLVSLVKEGAAAVKRKVPIKYMVASLQGDIIKEEWL
ncbi:4Fe-4S ferredoxin [Candidatus Saganbacteria bacterium]|nr:4Fe-4S ferredoxin [Candidatus Saganbacteria bacterium]